MSEINRRDALGAVGAVAAAGVLAATSVGAMPLPALAAGTHSPEFLAWYALATRTGEALAASNRWEEECIRQGKERPSAEYPIGLHWEAMRPLEEVLFARPVRSWTDVAEIGLIALYWSEGGDYFDLGRDPETSSEYQGSRPSAYLTQAVAKLAMGGGNVI